MKIRNRASVLCVSENRLLVVRLRDPVSGALVRMPPGGGLEPGESPAAAAWRELLEETGYTGTLDPASESIVEYTFDWAGTLHACRTHFFHASVQGEPGPVTATETFLEGCEWLPVAGLEAEWAYNPKLRAALLPLVTVAAAKTAARDRKKT